MQSHAKKFQYFVKQKLKKRENADTSPKLEERSRKETMK